MLRTDLIARGNQPGTVELRPALVFVPLAHELLEMFHRCRAYPQAEEQHQGGDLSAALSTNEQHGDGAVSETILSHRCPSASVQATPAMRAADVRSAGQEVCSTMHSPAADRGVPAPQVR